MQLRKPLFIKRIERIALRRKCGSPIRDRGGTGPGLAAVIAIRGKEQPGPRRARVRSISIRAGRDVVHVRGNWPSAAIALQCRIALAEEEPGARLKDLALQQKTTHEDR